MGNRIPEETIEAIRSSLDIVDVIGEFVQLRKQGRNYFGLCPFHGENTPSFSVSPEKQIYHCFGCGAGGNVFSFIMDLEGLSFVEAAVQLADKTGVTLDVQEFTEKDLNQPSQHSDIYKAYDLLQRLYHHLLLNTKEGEEALSYLYERGFTEEQLKTFQLGFAPNSWELQRTFLERRGFSLEEMEQAGLIGKRDSDGKYYDRFRNRIIFPINDLKGRTIAFGGRIIYDGEPKYLNSPETKIYHKSSTLYAFHLARPEIRKKREIVLFEGYVDVISAWKAGVKNGVASLGTSLTEEQANLIKRNAESVVICYDSDTAGIQATFRAAELLTKAGCYVKVARMPKGLDPDDYIRKFGNESFRNGVIGDSSTVMGFKMDFLRIGKNLQNEGERIRYIEEVLKEIIHIDKAVEKDHYLRQLAAEFSLSLEALKEQEEQLKSQTKRKDNQPSSRDNKIRSYPKKKTLLPAFQNAERFLLAHMLRDFDVALHVQEKIGCSFNIDEHNAIAVLLYAYYEEGHLPNIGAFMERLQDVNLKRITSELAMIEIDTHVTENVLEDYMRKIRKQTLLQEIISLENEKNNAERENDVMKAAKIAMEIIKMKRELKSP